MAVSRGIHTQPNQGATNSWLTPPEIPSALGKFDLDPCCPFGMPWRLAEKTFTEFEDGLWQPWKGRVWLNPPYGGELKRWIKRLAEHGNGIALVPARTEVESWFWPHIWEAASAVLFIRGRLYFHTVSGSLLGNAGHGSVLAAYGTGNANSLASCGIAGKYIRLKRAA